MKRDEARKDLDVGGRSKNRLRCKEKKDGEK